MVVMAPGGVELGSMMMTEVVPPGLVGVSVVVVGLVTEPVVVTVVMAPDGGEVGVRISTVPVPPGPVGVSVIVVVSVPVQLSVTVVHIVCEKVVLGYGGLGVKISTVPV